MVKEIWGNSLDESTQDLSKRIHKSLVEFSDAYDWLVVVCDLSEGLSGHLMSWGDYCCYEMSGRHVIVTRYTKNQDPPKVDLEKEVRAVLEKSMHPYPHNDVTLHVAQTVMSGIKVSTHFIIAIDATLDFSWEENVNKANMAQVTMDMVKVIVICPNLIKTVEC